MIRLGFRVWGLGFGVFLLNISLFAAIAPGGYYGYSYTPTPKSIEHGELGYATRFDFIGDNDIHHSILIRPLLFMELGLGISRNPTPAAKLILPFYEDWQGMAIGFSGKRWYFAGMLDWLTIAGIYDINLHAPVGSVVGELDLVYAVFSVENFWYLNKYGAAATFTLRPLAAFDVPSYLEASAGISWRSPEHTEEFFAYAAVQAKAPLLKTDKDPIAYLDINPAFDHSVSFIRNNYQLRAVFDMDAVLSAPFDFFLVGSLSPSLKTKSLERLLKRDIVDRYYLLWNSDKIPVWAACGMLNTDIYGCQTNMEKKLYNIFALTLGYTKDRGGEQTGLNAIGQIPLHPKFYNFLSNSLLFAEGGMFLGERLAVQLNFRQGTEKKHLQVGGGYDFDRKSIYGELSLKYDFSISTQVSGMAIRLAPNASHRESSDFYVFDYDIPIYQEGNSGKQSGKRLHNFPWKK